MLHRNFLVCTAIAAVATITATGADARSIRLDSGDWDTLVSTDSNANSSVTQAIGFDMSIFGVTGNTATVDANGSVALSGGAETATFNAMFDANQTAGDNVVNYSIEETNALFAQAGVESGLRFTWSALDSAGALANQFQLAMFELSSGLFALEFNYDVLTFGDDGSQIGYSTSLGESFDLTAALGLAFADLIGEGDFDPTFPDLCPSTPNALACNNYFQSVFGPSDSILPGIAGGYFLNLSGSDSTPVQGRYLWLSEAVDVVEPPTLAMLGLGMLALLAARRRRS